MKNKIHFTLIILNELLLLSIAIAMVVILSFAYKNMNFETAI